MKNTEVLIVGAGPTGLMLANLLAEEKISFRIIDQNKGRAKESRAMAIQARSLELFQKIGIVQEFLERGMRANGITIIVNGNSVTNINFSDIGRDDTSYPFILLLSQSITEEILEENLLQKYGIRVERNCSLKDFTQYQGSISVKCSLQDNNTFLMNAKYVVGCDGASSMVRQKLKLDFEGGTYDAEFMLADAKVNWDLPSDQVYLIFGEKTVSMLMPLKESSISRVITIGEKPTAKSRPSIQDIETKFQEAYMKPVNLTDAQWVSAIRIHKK